MKNIVLTGMRGSGKTRIGVEIAKMLKRQFIDLDEFIVRKKGRSIPEIVKEGGWPAFRKLEKEACCATSKIEGAIIATGGGAILYKENCDYLKKNGYLVLLTVDTKELILRLRHSKNRPPIKKNGKSFLDELEEVWQERKKAYMGCADMLYDASKNTGNKKKDIREKAKDIIYLLKEK